MSNRWSVTIAALALALALARPGLAQDFSDDLCDENGGTQFTVDTAADVAVVANGYRRTDCDIIIRRTIAPIDVRQFLIEARSITIEGTAADRVEVINTLARGEVNLRARVGNLTIRFADVQALNFVRPRCDGAGCQIVVEDSSIIASDPPITPAQLLDPNTPNPTSGTLNFNAQGGIFIVRSTVFGGAFNEMDAKTGSIVWRCVGPGVGICVDPLANQTGLKAVCGDPPVFPCVLQDINDAHTLCVPAGLGNFCGGGSKEMRLTAAQTLDIEGSTIVAGDHITLDSKNSDVLARGSVISVEAQITVVARRFVDLREAVWDANRIRVTTGNLCAAPAVCIDLEGAQLTASSSMQLTANTGNGIIHACDAALHVLGSGVPRLNGDSDPTDGYDPNVIDTVVECAPKPPLVAD